MTAHDDILPTSHSPHPEAAPWGKVLIGEVKTFPYVPRNSSRDKKKPFSFKAKQLENLV